MPIAKVEPLTTARALRGPFDYRLPERLGEVGVGSVLLVPFGRRRVLGVVVEVAESSELPPERLAEPIQALAAGAPPELVAARPLGRRASTARPPPAGSSSCCRPGGSARGQRARAGGELVAARHRPAEPRSATGAGWVRASAPRWRRRDGPASWRRRARGRAARPSTRCAARGPGAGLEPGRRELRRRPPVVAVGAPSTPARRSTPRSSAALDAVVAGVDGDAARELLAHGVTGSGKTEVYLARRRGGARAGHGAIVLVPEIGSRHRRVAVRARFGDRVALLHSRLAAGERRDEWQRLRAGEARICVGPRSAVFAPVRDLGLVVSTRSTTPPTSRRATPATTRARSPAAGRPRRGAALVCRQRHAAAGELAGAARGSSCRAARDGASCRRSSSSTCAGSSPRRGRSTRATAEALAEVRAAAPRRSCSSTGAAGRRSSAAARCGHAWSARTATSRSSSTAASERLRCHHCGHAEPVPRRAPNAARLPWRATAPGRSA